MKLKDIKFKDDEFDAQWLVDLHNMETGDNKTLEEFADMCEPPLVLYTSKGIPLAKAYKLSSVILLGTITGWLDKGWLFEFAKWLDMDLYLDLMRLAVSSLGLDNVK